MKRVEKYFTCTFAGAAIAAVVDTFILEHIFFVVKKYPVGNIGAGKKVIRILHLTDLHLRKRLSFKYKKLARRIGKISPDIIFISGDSIDSSGNLNPLEQFLNLLDNRIPKVAVPGNHEYAADINIEALKAVYKRANGDLLINESRNYKIKDTIITVTGLDDSLEGNENFSCAIQGVKDGQHHFVLMHSPQSQEYVKMELERLNRGRKDKLNIFGFFAGHNHGGQVKLGNYAPFLPPKSGGYVEGWYNEEKPYLYVSRGFGTSRIPVRFWSRSEITLFMYYV